MSQEQKSASIVKSGFLWKKGEGVLGATYKERLFELKLTGKLDYFDVSSGTKIFKGTILLTSSSKIIIRKNLPSDQNKFIIKTQQRVWYLWCKDKNANQQIQQWCNSINDMINSSKSLTKNNDQKQTEITHENTNNNIIEQTNASSDELIGDSPTPQDIIAMHPTNPNQPFNPFYGSSISTTSVTEQQKHDINPYYASLNSKPSNVMESKEDINILPTAPMDMELNEEFENMNIDIGFKISENVSLKSVLFGSWLSYNIECEYLYGVTNLPMINERFIFKCIDNMNNIYTIQTCNGLYLSGSVDGNIKFVKKYYGIYEQWIIKYKHINNIYIQSKYYNTYFGIDSNGFCHHKYPSVSNIIMFELSPPVIIHKNNTNYINNNDTSIQYPTINGLSIALCCCINGNFIGIENRNANEIQCNYTTYQSFDGNVMSRSTFNIIKDKNNYKLYAFKSILNGKYISPIDNITGGKIKFVSELTDKEFFEVIWHDVNIISLIAYNGTILKVGKNNILYNVYGYKHLNNGNMDCNYLFQIKSKSFDRINSDINSIPICQLPIRNINGQIKRDIWLKGHSGNVEYLAYRSKPYRYEAVSKIMGRWETIRFKHDLLKTNIKKECIVSLFTENGMVIACDCNGQITYLNGEDVNDICRCRWKIYFHNYALISIQNYKYKGWMILKKSNKESNVYVLDIINPNFDQNGTPIVDVQNARGFKNLYCQFDLCPIANCKQNIDVSKNYKKQNSAVSFAM